MIIFSDFSRFIALFPQNYKFFVEDEATFNVFNEKEQYVGFITLPQLTFTQEEGTIVTKAGDKILSIQFKK